MRKLLTTFGLLLALAAPAVAQQVLGGVNLNAAPPVNSIGNESQWYIDLGSGKVWGPKTAGAWPGSPVATFFQNGTAAGGVLNGTYPNPSFATNAGTAHQWFSSIAAGALVSTQPAFSDLSDAGSVTGALKDNGSGVLSKAATTDLSDVTTPTTWTPTDASGAGLIFTGVSASYTKIGNMVYAYAALTYPSTADASAAKIGGLPVTVPNQDYAAVPCTFSTNAFATVTFALLLKGTTTFGLYKATEAGALNSDMSGKAVNLICIYPAS